MAAKKDRVLIHHFKVQMQDDPAASDATAAKMQLENVPGVVDVEYVRSGMKVTGGK